MRETTTIEWCDGCGKWSGFELSAVRQRYVGLYAAHWMRNALVTRIRITAPDGHVLIIERQS